MIGICSGWGYHSVWLHCTGKEWAGYVVVPHVLISLFTTPRCVFCFSSCPCLTILHTLVSCLIGYPSWFLTLSSWFLDFISLIFKSSPHSIIAKFSTGIFINFPLYWCSNLSIFGLDSCWCFQLFQTRGRKVRRKELEGVCDQGTRITAHHSLTPFHLCQAFPCCGSPRREPWSPSSHPPPPPSPSSCSSH